MKINQIISALILFSLMLCIFASCTYDVPVIGLPSYGGDAPTSSSGIDLSQIYLIEPKRVLVERPPGIADRYDYEMVLYKYNILAGTSTPLCQDPFCNHLSGSECMFKGSGGISSFAKDGQSSLEDVYFSRPPQISPSVSGIYSPITLIMPPTSVAMHGEWIYFIKADSSTEWISSNALKEKSIRAICAYNVVTDELQFLYLEEETGELVLEKGRGASSSTSSPSIGASIEYFDGHIYFKKSEFDEETNVLVPTIQRLNVNTKKIETMYELDGIHDILIMRTEDHIYWHNMTPEQDPMTNNQRLFPVIYRTDHWRNNREEVTERMVKVNGSDGKENIYVSYWEYDGEGDVNDDSSYSYVNRINVAGAEPKFIYGAFNDVYNNIDRASVIMGDYIYYLIREDEDTAKVMYTDSKGTEHKVFYSGVARVKLDGGGHEVLLNGESLDLWFIESFGKYIVISYREEMSEDFARGGIEYGLADQKLVYDTVAEKWLEYE